MPPRFKIALALNSKLWILFLTGSRIHRSVDYPSQLFGTWRASSALLFYHFDEGGSMLFIAGLFVGTFVGIMIAGLCYAARENTRVETSPGSMKQSLGGA
jgi:hypothetical protein